MIGLTRWTTVAASPPLYQLAHLAMSRLFSGVASAAAVAQPQANYYDYYEDKNERERLRDQLAAVPLGDSEGAVPIRGVQWVFIGRPGSKRHVYAVRLSRLLEVPHISMATLVRQDLNPRSSLYKKIANAVNCGELVPEDIVFGLLAKRLQDGYYRGESGFILDGIPRSPFQAEMLDQLAEVDLVVNFKCREDCLVKHQGDVPWKEKPQVYPQKSEALEEYYRKQEKLLDFQICSAPGETWKGLLTALHLQHINAAYSSHKLTPGSERL